MLFGQVVMKNKKIKYFNLKLHKPKGLYESYAFMNMRDEVTNGQQIEANQQGG